ncbi:MAG: hypothetical protein ACPIOQ_23075 [Promethearchaeia archaeon]
MKRDANLCPRQPTCGQVCCPPNHFCPTNACALAAASLALSAASAPNF